MKCPTCERDDCNGLRHLLGAWPGDETDEEVDEALYGDKRRREAAYEAAGHLVRGEWASNEELHQLIDALKPIARYVNSSNHKDGK